MPPVKINGQIVELSSCLLLLLVVGLCVLSFPSLRQEARHCLIIESERMRERDRGNETERQRQRDGEKRRLGEGVERGGRER